LSSGLLHAPSALTFWRSDTMSGRNTIASGRRAWQELGDCQEHLEVTAIWRAIQNGDPDLAERCCVDHVKAAAVAALSMIERSSAAKEPAANM
jgi:DNA-binding GntR family transcriptional regulator